MGNTDLPQQQYNDFHNVTLTQMSNSSTFQWLSSLTTFGVSSLGHFGTNAKRPESDIIYLDLVRVKYDGEKLEFKVQCYITMLAE